MGWREGCYAIKTPPGITPPPLQLYKSIYVQNQPLGAIPLFQGHFFYKSTKIPTPFVWPFFLQTQPLGAIIYKIDLTSHFLQNHTLGAMPFFSAHFFLTKAQKFATSVLKLQAHPQCDFVKIWPQKAGRYLCPVHKNLPCFLKHKNVHRFLGSFFYKIT